MTIEVLEQNMNILKEQTEKEIEKLQNSVNDLDSRVKEMEMSKQKTEYQYEQIIKSLETLNEKTIPKLAAQIEELKNRPVKRYDQAVTAILGAIFGAVGSFIINIFLGGK